MAKQDNDANTDAESKTERSGKTEPGKSASSADSQEAAGARTPSTADGTPGASSRPESENRDGAAAAGQVQVDAIALLKADHRKVEQLFSQYSAANDRRKAEIVRQVCAELTIHTLLEEEIFYPACRRAADEEEPLDEAQVEHDSAKLLIEDLMAGASDDPYRDAKVKVLSEQIRHHVAEEEKPGSGVFAKAQAAKLDLADLGRRLQARKQQLQARGDDLPPARLVSLDIDLGDHSRKEDYMPRGQNTPDRDERGRFTSDDDYDRGRSRARGYDDDDDRGYRSRGRDDDDGRGWYGDSRGHAEAARRGWAERRGGEERSFARGRDYDDDRDGRGRGNDRDRDDRGRFVSDDDDDRRGYRSRGRDYDDDDRRSGGRGGERERDERGRFTDDDRDGGRGGYRSRGRDDEGRGWFGDPEGHAEAARRGWAERNGGSSARGRDDDDRGGYRSRGADRDDRGRFSRDDDDRGGRSGGGRGHGGWFGDSRGHAEAARRGWDDRR